MSKHNKMVRQEDLYSLLREIIKDNDDVGISTFFHVGVAYMLLMEMRAVLKDTGRKVNIVSNDPGLKGRGTGLLIREDLLNSITVSYVGTNREAEEKYVNNELDVFMYPQDTLIRKLLAGAAAGPKKNLAGVLTRTGFGTKAARGKRIFEHAGFKYIFEPALRARVGFIKTWITDKKGNSIYDKAARNFNPVMAKASDMTIAEADYIVDGPGSLPRKLRKYLDDSGEYLDPNIVVTPGRYIDHVVLSDGRWKEDLKVESAGEQVELDPKRIRIVKRAAQEIRDGDTVNLGIGTPTYVADFIPADITVYLQSENGIWGMGPSPVLGEEDNNLINAGRFAVTLKDGGAYFCTTEAFDMITGGYIDKTILGAFEVSEKGDLANNEIPGKRAPGFGGAPALLAGAGEVIIATEHLSKGRPRIVEKCALPLTGKEVVNKIITDMAFIEVTTEGLVLKEIAGDTTVEEVVEKTVAKLIVSPELKVMNV